MKFSNRYEVIEKEPTPAGSRLKDEYEMFKNEHGEKQLRKTGETDVYEIIQSFAEECSLEKIIERALNGDPRALREEGQFLDLTNMPTSVAQAQSMLAEVKDQFNRLDPKQKRKFKNLDEFAAQYATNEWVEKMGYDIEEVNTETKIEKKEVKDDE